MGISNTSLEKLFDIRDAFEQSVKDDVKAVGEQLGEGPFNSRHALSWDLTYRQIKAAAKACGMVVVPAKRGFWDFYLTLDMQSRELFVYMKEPNTNVSARKDWHYLNCLLFKHDALTIELLEDMIEEENLLKRKVVQEMLGNYEEAYDRVLVVSKTSAGQSVHHTSLKLYSSEGTLLESELIPNRPNDDNEVYKPDTKPHSPIEGIALKQHNEENLNDKKLFDIENLKSEDEQKNVIK